MLICRNACNHDTHLKYSDIAFVIGYFTGLSDRRTNDDERRTREGRREGRGEDERRKRGGRMEDEQKARGVRGLILSGHANEAGAFSQ